MMFSVPTISRKTAAKTTRPAPLIWPFLLFPDRHQGRSRPNNARYWAPRWVSREYAPSPSPELKLFMRRPRSVAAAVDRTHLGALIRVGDCHRSTDQVLRQRPRHRGRDDVGRA